MTSCNRLCQSMCRLGASPRNVRRRTKGSRAMRVFESETTSLEKSGYKNAGGKSVLDVRAKG
jgi:hypothetical protein